MFRKNISNVYRNVYFWTEKDKLFIKEDFMAKEPDRRSTRTKKALKRVMLELLSKKDISKITVSELSERADIGRGTFYLHYADPYDLLDKLENELLEQVTAHVAPISESRDRDSLLLHMERVWQCIYGQLETFKILMNRRNVARFMEKFKAYSEKSAFAAITNEYNKDETDSYGVIYIISGTLGIFQKWMEQGAPIPPEKLAQIARDLIM
jgi:AcrR family transcriptional regulator